MTIQFEREIFCENVEKCFLFVRLAMKQNNVFNSKPEFNQNFSAIRVRESRRTGRAGLAALLVDREAADRARQHEAAVAHALHSAL